MVHPLQTSVLRVMEASADTLNSSGGERLRGLVISPYVVASTVIVMAALVAVLAGPDLTLWVVVVGVASGWSSAWSP